MGCNQWPKSLGRMPHEPQALGPWVVLDQLLEVGALGDAVVLMLVEAAASPIALPWGVRVAAEEAPPVYLMPAMVPTAATYHSIEGSGLFVLLLLACLSRS